MFQIQSGEGGGQSRQVEEVTVNTDYVIATFSDRSCGIHWLLLSPPAFPVTEPMSTHLTAWPPRLPSDYKTFFQHI